MKTVQEIEQEIAGLKEQLQTVEGTPNEVYSRIVGYYRSVKNWNKGKREEYRYRKEYIPVMTDMEVHQGDNIERKPSGIPMSVIENIAGYTYFYRKTCPNCPPVKDYLSALDFEGRSVDVDSGEGLQEAVEQGVLSAPSVIFVDDTGTELFRAFSIEEMNRILHSLVVH